VSFNGVVGRVLLTLFNNLIKASRESSSKSAATTMNQPFWMGYLYTGLRNPNSKNLGA